LAKKLDEKGNVLEDRNLLDLLLDTGKNGDEIDELLTIAVSRNELKTLCEILRGIGEGEPWLKLCLSIRLEYLTDKEINWKTMNLFSMAYNESFGEWLTIRVLRSDLFYPLYFWTLHQLSQGRLSPKMCNECIDMFQKVGWQEAIHHLEHELGFDSSEVFDRISSIDMRKPSSGHVCPQCKGSGVFSLY
jgi:hypothetical protein